MRPDPGSSLRFLLCAWICTGLKHASMTCSMASSYDPAPAQILRACHSRHEGILQISICSLCLHITISGSVQGAMPNRAPVGCRLVRWGAGKSVDHTTKVRNSVFQQLKMTKLDQRTMGSRQPHGLART